MVVYRQRARQRLAEKLDYEVWLLGFIADRVGVYEGQEHLSRVVLTDRQPTARMEAGLGGTIGGRAALAMINAMSALTFSAAYKCLDMVFEWVLEENYPINIYAKKPPSKWTFTEKTTKLPLLSLDYPPLLRLHAYIRDYLLALYTNLLKFRNEVVHRHNFSVHNDVLTVEVVESGKTDALALDRRRLGALVRIAVGVANALAGVEQFGMRQHAMLQYHLDQLQDVHGLAVFGRQRPLALEVVLKVPGAGGLFPADLQYARQVIRRTHSDAWAVFDLEVEGVVHGQTVAKWRFPADAVPQANVVSLRVGGRYEKYRVPG